DGKQLISSADDGMVRIWDIASGKELRKWQGHDSGTTGGMALSTDGKLLATADYKTIRLWEVATAKQIRRMPSEGAFSRMFRALAFSPDGKQLAAWCGSQHLGAGKWDYPVVLWDVGIGKELRRLSGHERDVHSLAFTPDGRTVVSEGEDNSIRFWELAT